MVRRFDSSGVCHVPTLSNVIRFADITKMEIGFGIDFSVRRQERNLLAFVELLRNAFFFIESK
ncbi:hypothetical protein OAF98_05575 [Planctomicrobium sp.]|nr:hypothetical protein [Planctomicrobium sp.]MDB4743937.1 hypothetical protein [Planctomicrobium sp.]